jgi:phosphate transport system substrate-binding protein
LTRTRHPLLTVVAVVSSLNALALSSSATATATSLTGAGSTLVAPLEAYWGQGFEHQYGYSVTYAAVGSGAGIAQISARTVDFGASDAPMTPTQAQACKSCTQIPWALTATGIAFNVKGVSRLRLTGPVLSDIYLGKIVNWDSPAIAKLNRGEKLPNLAITPVFRSDGSGDTYAFTDYLSRVNAQWKSQVGNATSVSFPKGVGGKGNDGVTAVVSTTDGSLGYISASYIIAHGLKAAQLRNAAGKYEYPNLKNISNAAASVKSVPANNEMHIVNPPKQYKIAYPLSTFTYAIVPTTAPQKRLLADWVYYAITAGQQFGAQLDFAPIPAVVLHAAVNSVKTLQQG